MAKGRASTSRDAARRVTSSARRSTVRPFQRARALAVEEDGAGRGARYHGSLTRDWPPSAVTAGAAARRIRDDSFARRSVSGLPPLELRASRPRRLRGRARGGVGARLEHDGPHLVALDLEPRRRLCADRLGRAAAGPRAARDGLAVPRR